MVDTTQTTATPGSTKMKGDEQAVLDDLIGHLLGQQRLNQMLRRNRWAQVPIDVHGSVRTWLDRYLRDHESLWGYDSMQREHRRLVTYVQERLQ